MTRCMLIDALHPEETRVVITENNQILDFDFVTSAKKQIKGNIYLAKVTRVEPSLQAAFVEYGGNKQGFLPFSEIHPDYYQIPVSDRKKLIEEEEKALAEEIDDHEEDPTQKKKERGRRRRRRSRSAAAEQKDIVATGDAEEETGEEGDAAVSANTEQDENDSTAQEREEESADPQEELDEKEREEVPTLGDDEDLGRERKRASYSRRYKIQEVIKRNQILLVQVIKEERGNKGVSLSTYISLAGRYCVLMPNSSKAGGISRKISSSEDRKRLKKIVQDLKTAKGMSVIVRTAGMDRTRAEVKRDFDYLVKLWNQIREDTLASTAPALVYEESDVIKRSLRDLYNSDIEKVLVAGDDAYRNAKDFMKMMMPSHAARIKQYKHHRPIFFEYGIEDQIATMYDPSVKLRSGGYIVLNSTEALIAIDVNSGRSTGERNIEETATKTNLEAVKEIARQLRLRDLAGLVVIDFIDMMDGKNRRAVERAMRDALKYDRAKIQLGRISSFGLMELSRQRLRPSISETSYSDCPHCKGTGLLRVPASLGIEIIRTLEHEASSGKYEELKVHASIDMLEHLLNARRENILQIEADYGVHITVHADSHVQGTQYSLDRGQRRQDRPDRQEKRNNTATQDEKTTQPPLEDSRDEDREERKRTRSSSRRRRKDKDEGERRDDRSKPESSDSTQDEVRSAADGDDEKEKRKPRRRSRSRGRGRSEKTDSGSTSQDTKQAKSDDSKQGNNTAVADADDTSGNKAPKKVAAEKDSAPAPASEVAAANENREPQAAAPKEEKKRTSPPRRGWWNRVLE